MKKTNNAGFSLVELIVVIAIMAVLVGVLAPQLLRYVERSRVSTDNQAVAEVANAIKIAMADETIYNSVKGSTGSQVTLTLGTADASTAAFSGGTTQLLEEVKASCGPGVYFKAACYSSAQPSISVSVVNGSVIIKATGMCDTDSKQVAANTSSYVDATGQTVSNGVGEIYY